MSMCEQMVNLYLWSGNNVYILSTHAGIEPQESVTMWPKAERKFIDVTCSSVVRKYIQCMGGIDICDQQMECYCTWFRTRKWTLKCILHEQLDALCARL